MRRDMLNETALIIDSEIKSLIDGGRKRAVQVQTENIDHLHSVAGALLEYETLTGDEIKQIAAGEDINRPDAGGDGVDLAEQRDVDPEDQAAVGAVWESGVGWGVGFEDSTIVVK